MSGQNTKRKKKKEGAHLVIIGFGEIIGLKYTDYIKRAITNKHIESFSVIEVEEKKEVIEKRISSIRNFKPENIFYIPKDISENLEKNNIYIDNIFKKILLKHEKIKVYIATEVMAHERYLKYCVSKDIESLVEKPVFAPMTNGTFDPSKLVRTMSGLILENKRKSAKHSVMSLSRYHDIYNVKLINPLYKLIKKTGSPITSIHMRHAGGVWNLHSEYDSRDDHPYKHGYGMLMHGAYHYIDILAQLLGLNRIIYPNQKFLLSVSSFAAYPKDQNDRISKEISSLFNDNKTNWPGKTNTKYGETDITTTFCLKNKGSGKTITLGTVSMEQTTPSIRNWKDFPDNEYNKNGRTSCVDIEVQLSTIHSVNVKCFDVPKPKEGDISRIDATAQILERSNANILKDRNFTSFSSYHGLFHSDSNKKLISNWLSGKELNSLIETHLDTIKIIESIALSIKKPGVKIETDY